MMNFMNGWLPYFSVSHFISVSVCFPGNLQAWLPVAPSVLLDNKIVFEKHSRMALYKTVQLLQIIADFLKNTQWMPSGLPVRARYKPLVVSSKCCQTCNISSTLLIDHIEIQLFVTVAWSDTTGYSLHNYDKMLSPWVGLLKLHSLIYPLWVFGIYMYIYICVCVCVLLSSNHVHVCQVLL